MTRRKIHYWLKTDLLGAPLRAGSRGTPVLLSFEQVLRVKTLQHLRDELRFSLPRARRALAKVVTHLFGDEWQRLTFFRTERGFIGAMLPSGESIEIETSQAVMPVLPELERFMHEVRGEWEAKVIPISGYKHLHSNARVLAGSPVVAGTRVETAFVANLMRELPVEEIHRILFPTISTEALNEVARFEEVEPVAA